MIMSAAHIRSLDKGMSKSKGNRRECIGHCWIHLNVVSLIEILLPQVQIKQTTHIPTQHQRQEFTVGNMLHHSPDNATTLMEQFLVAPMLVQSCQFVGHAVVLRHHDMVNSQKTWLLTASGVSCADALIGKGTALADIFTGRSATKV